MGRFLSRGVLGDRGEEPVGKVGGMEPS